MENRTSSNVKAYNAILFRQRRARLNITLSAITFLCLPTLWIIRQSLTFGENAFLASPTSLLLTSATLVLFGLAMIANLYLRGDFILIFRKYPPSFMAQEEVQIAEAEDTSNISEEWKRLRRELDDVQLTLTMQRRGNDNSADFDYERVIESLKSHVNDQLIEDLEARFVARAQLYAYVQSVRVAFKEAGDRLLKEISALSRRGNLNLIIGGFTTLVAVGLLTFMVLWEHHTFDSWPALLSHYIPRVTTAAFIEVFAFFFLRLYRSSLAEIRHYQSEMTSLAIKHIAFEAAHAVNDKHAKVMVVKRLVHNSEKSDSPKPKSSSPNDDTLKELANLAEQVTKLTKVVVDSSKSGDK